ncbi:hypothetical protein DSD19_05020 [Rhodovulum sp. BSW8]|uniref:Uncharacterized protein n=1 Tax=Rhodovulum visakhapatnamense TaxID=364297 RepID=A0A4R8G7H2_9RHOB|nr:MULTISPECIES: hypothetical protein [Rhodovulum]OLS45015.1 hypothetical protein BV509_12150 [Rhodovulum sulfidophilum]MBL3570219.1 hypothetical protein [Rhodovulum visakhapatnamense]MBL3580652.1 hypothetical protein [Rhodovulum visakhapatnamense]RBO54735.1 hypothetical protein DSD19_05020 [Rhodovulum sp. BSW8]TDX32582.1 hypothetical protein EV657_103153 [Rhodovulum visakhapatnamense]
MLVLFTLASIAAGALSALAGALLLDSGWATVLLCYWLGGMVGGGAAVTVVALRDEPEDDTDRFVGTPPDLGVGETARTRPDPAKPQAGAEPVEADPGTARSRICEGCDSH